jgi:valyl-tRNA synthetase
MGLSIDWTKIYSTISDKARKISQYSFIDLFEKGLAYRKSEPALYCTTCRTSVAQAELDSTEISTTFNDLEFETENGGKLTISTTRPELLPACVAVFYHPNDTRYQILKGQYAIVPIFGQKVKILSDENVNPKKGSGLVMCCTFGDQTDILWFKKHTLPFVQIIGLDGTWKKEAGILEGLRVHEARKKIIELLKNAGKLLGQKKITHAVNTHERCKQEIEYQILQQWFIKILENKNKFLEFGEQIKWIPEFMKARYIDWVEHLGWDWCISRQRFYGIPFPVWYCKDCNEILVAKLEDLPIDPQETTYPGETCPRCSSKNITPDTDIIDTWATSAITPQINTNWLENKQLITIPMGMRPHAHDIIRTWTFYTIVKSCYHFNKIPWKEVVISGHVLAGKEKISKSKGNKGVPTPYDLLEKYPADVVRYWAANGKLGTDTAFSQNQLKIGQRLVTKLWNAFRFCKDHIKNYNNTQVNVEQIDNLNKWLLQRFSNTVKKYNSYFENYNYTQALEITEKFFWQDFCDNYIELIKDQIFNPQNYDLQSIQNTQFALYHVGLGILKLFAPILPHITETLYQHLFKEKVGIQSIHITVLNEKTYDYNFKTSETLIDIIVTLVAHCRKLKTEQQISLKTEIENLIICSSNKTLLNQIKKEEKLITGITKAKTVKYREEILKTNSLEQKDNLYIMKVGF